MNFPSKPCGALACRPAILMIAASLAAGVHARTLHVVCDGNDANSGTPELPLRTIQRPAEVASNGYTNVEDYLNELAGDAIPETE